MDVKEAIQELGNVVNHCSYLMPKEWRERHLEDAKEAIETIHSNESEVCPYCRGATSGWIEVALFSVEGGILWRDAQETMRFCPRCGRKL